ncbi:DUF6597 domain-containing transcriptional factor, partial [Roseisolibacter sp. H3M3-2]|uniref:DUF6597 domain-containing transcriptional factor n=1 Tax=Roseisolibacter sp. H3M3-2 TaxID=3031323 RepID=UPI0023DCCB2D
MPALHYREFAPAPALADDALSHWWFEADLPPDGGHDHHVWPDGCVSVGVQTRAGAPPLAVLAGPALAAPRVRLEGAVRFRGVRLWPDRGAALLGVPASRLRGLRLPLALVLGEAEGD